MKRRLERIDESIARYSAELHIESSLVLETYAAAMPPFQITPDALRYPFVYSADDRIDLGRMLGRQYPDPRDKLGAWARGFVRSNPTNPTDTSALLADLNNGVATQISYQSRETEGTQTHRTRFFRIRGRRVFGTPGAAGLASLRGLCP